MVGRCPGCQSREFPASRVTTVLVRQVSAASGQIVTQVAADTLPRGTAGFAKRRLFSVATAAQIVKLLFEKGPHLLISHVAIHA